MVLPVACSLLPFIYTSLLMLTPWRPDSFKFRLPVSHIKLFGFNNAVGWEKGLIWVIFYKHQVELPVSNGFSLVQTGLLKTSAAKTASPTKGWHQGYSVPLDRRRLKGDP